MQGGGVMHEITFGLMYVLHMPLQCELARKVPITFITLERHLDQYYFLALFKSQTEKS